LLGWSSPALAQEPAKDDELDKLLQKLDTPKPPEDKKDSAPADVKKKDEAKEDEAKKGDGDAKDKDLDSLLEKLGETEEKPSPRGRPQPNAGPDDAGSLPPPKPGKPEPGGGLKGQSKDLDEHLEELTGRKKKKKSQEQQADQGNGPLNEAIKKMDEVQRRLSKTDTGEGTRKTQGEIVKQLDQILEQLRQAANQGQGRKITRRVRQAGTKPGDSQDDMAGNTGSGVGPSKPLRPSAKSSLANSKDAWGDLPPQLREEMENVFKEDMLPAKRKLIERYYMSLSKKSRDRGE
jgi:hypothetical protein